MKNLLEKLILISLMATTAAGLLLTILIVGTILFPLFVWEIGAYYAKN